MCASARFDSPGQPRAALRHHDANRAAFTLFQLQT
jgi:hypothetical protein